MDSWKHGEVGQVSAGEEVGDNRIGSTGRPSSRSLPCLYDGCGETMRVVNPFKLVIWSFFQHSKVSPKWHDALASSTILRENTTTHLSSTATNP